MPNPDDFYSDETRRVHSHSQQKQTYSPNVSISENPIPLQTVVRKEETVTVGFAIGKLNEFIQWFITVIEVTLAIRFILKLIGADPNNLFAGFLYALTDIILFPFSSIVRSTSIHPPYQSFEWSTLIAMAIYASLFWGISRFLLILPSPEEPPSIDIIRSAINNTSYSNYQQLARAIIHRIDATDERPIELPGFVKNTVWEISLPSIGLRLDTGKAILFLRKTVEDSTFHEYLLEKKSDTRSDFLLVVDHVNSSQPLPFIDSGIVWLKPENLKEMVNTPKDEVVAWLGRLIASQVRNFEDLILYHTEGSVDLAIFFGRDYELQRLSSGTVQGGIIVGAHKSGKTSLLVQLGERLKEQQYVVGGPYTIHNTNVQTFIYDTLRELHINVSVDSNLEAWSSLLREHSKEGERLVLLLDEVDILLDRDAKTGHHLGHEMRALQNDGYCKFYLAGHNALREAITLEGGPFRNFAEEITLRGLEESAGIRLIREPIRAIGFTVSTQQAQRIFQGTAGVAVLIQGFCRRLLLKIHHGRASDVLDSTINSIEEDPEYLNMVFDYYEYAQSRDSMAVMLIIALLKEATRQDIIQIFSKYSVSFTWDQLDQQLKFLVRFGVLEEFEAGRYQILSKYLYSAIEARSRGTDAFLIAQLEKGKGNNG